MADARYPVLYQINTRVWLTGLSRALGRRATLDDIPDAELDRLAALGFDWVWLLSVWQTGPAAQAISRVHAANSPRRCRTSRTTTSRAPGSQSAATRFIANWAAPRRSPACGSACSNAD
ncbi:hypothetical protein [Paraburkholderia sp. SIMBA_030]|uniref:hypothetical protein n=1 Tax=Paraburkholderia sp. SIMBA_030 TaxID=3085773 RepID=UPI00397993F5